jgi:hypothetical protein
MIFDLPWSSDMEESKIINLTYLRFQVFQTLENLPYTYITVASNPAPPDSSRNPGYLLPASDS